MNRKIRSWGLVAGLAVLVTAPARSHELDHHAADHHATGVPHFTHPLIAESPSPDTKLRLDYFFRDEEGGERHSLRLEGEYAFAPWLSLEVDVPYTAVNPDDGESQSNLDTVEAALKLAIPHLWTNVLLGGGIEFGLPTGDDPKGIGSNNELEIAPFLDFGVMLGDLQTVAFVTFAIPTNQDPEEAPQEDLVIGFNVAFAYPVTPRLWGLLEVDGTTIAAGEKDETVVNVTPGLKLRPFEDVPFDAGLGVSVPISDDQAFDVRTILSGFYHF